MSAKCSAKRDLAAAVAVVVTAARAVARAAAAALAVVAATAVVDADVVADAADVAMARNALLAPFSVANGWRNDAPAEWAEVWEDLAWVAVAPTNSAKLFKNLRETFW